MIDPLESRSSRCVISVAIASWLHECSDSGRWNYPSPTMIPARLLSLSPSSVRTSSKE